MSDGDTRHCIWISLHELELRWMISLYERTALSARITPLQESETPMSG